MQIVIVGGGKLGISLAQHLVNEGHNVTMVDRNEAVVQRSMDTMDAMFIHGSGVSADTAASQESTEKTVTLANVVFADTEGNTFAYLIDEAGTIYKIAVAADETVVALTAGDSVTVTYPVSYDGAEVIPVSDVLRE